MKAADLHAFYTTDESLTRTIVSKKRAKKKASGMITQQIMPQWSGFLLALLPENRLNHDGLVVGSLRRQALIMNAFGFIRPSEEGPVTFFFENVEDAVLGKVKYG